VEDSISVSLWIILESEAWIRMGGIQDSNSGFWKFRRWREVRKALIRIGPLRGPSKGQDPRFRKGDIWPRQGLKETQLRIE
jgi:hypothetical protein